MAQYAYPEDYAIIAISSIAVIFCMLLIIALLIPLLKDLNTPSEPAFSSYNLYLIYLAIPDLLLNLYLVITYGFNVNQNSYYDLIYHEYFQAAFTVACSTAKLVRLLLLLISACLLRNALQYQFLTMKIHNVFVF
jgi:hypothetical protein